MLVLPNKVLSSKVSLIHSFIVAVVKREENTKFSLTL